MDVFEPGEIEVEQPGGETVAVGVEMGEAQAGIDALLPEGGRPGGQDGDVGVLID